MRQLVNDDTALSGIDTKVTNAMSQLDNDDSALTVIKDDVTSALAEFSRLTNREYGYTHEAIVTDDLEKDYQDIITANPDLANVSAVGMLAILKDGDTVTAQGNRLFINGEEVVNLNGYTFRGTNSQNGIEIVKIWYFEKDNTLELNRISGFVNEIIVNNSGTSATFSSDFFDYANEIISNAPIPYTPIGVRKQKFTDVTASHRVSSVIEEYESNAINLPNGWESLYSRQMLKKAVFPNLTSISNNTSTRRFFNDCIRLIDLSFPLLEYIGDSTYYYFSGVHTLTLPESLLTIGGIITTNNKNIILNCKNATSIADNWCSSAPTESFVMCADWGASINIAVAASGWAPERFTTIPAVRNPTDTYYLYNLLKQVDYVPTTHTIKISSRYVTDDLVDAYLEIGWDLVGM